MHTCVSPIIIRFCSLKHGHIRLNIINNLFSTLVCCSKHVSEKKKNAYAIHRRVSSGFFVRVGTTVMAWTKKVKGTFVGYFGSNLSATSTFAQTVLIFRRNLTKFGQ